jgi:hypothetical protein
MNAFRHARNSAKRFGGKPDEYQEFHDFIDSSKAHHGDIRHRALFHSTLGCFLAERIFGKTFKNSAGRTVAIRDIIEYHIIEDLGKIPSVSEYLNNMTMQPWMGGPSSKPTKKKKVIKL